MKSLRSYVESLSRPVAYRKGSGYQVEGYPEYYIQFDLHGTNPEIYHEPDFSRPVCKYAAYWDRDDALHYDDEIIYRENLYASYDRAKLPELTDEEYDVIESEDFIAAVFDRTIPYIPVGEFRKDM